MWRFAYLFAAVVFLGISVAAALLAGVDQQEGLAVDRAVHDFGRLYQGDTVTASFVLTNNTADPIEILCVRPRCDCTTTSLDHCRLDPGELVSLTTIWKIGASRGQTSTTLWIEYEQGPPADRHIWQRPLSLAADVLPDIVYTPSELNFSRGNAATKRVVFSPGRLKEFQLLEAYSTHRAFDAQLLADNSAVKVSYDPSKWVPDELTKVQARLVVRTTSAIEFVSTIRLEVK